MTNKLAINGSLYLTFLDLDGEELEHSVQEEIMKQLIEGNYVISLNNKTVSSLDKLGEVIYLFYFDVGGSTDYCWEILED